MSVLSWLRRSNGDRLPPDRTEELLAKYLDKDFRVFPLADASVKRSQFEALEQKFGVRYPAEFIAHVLGRFPGIYVEVKEEVWPRPKLHDVGPFWSFLYGFHTYTSAPESEHWMRLEAAAESLREQEPELKISPILRIVGDADLYCVSADATIVRYRHETGDVEPFAGNYWDLFEMELKQLRERKNRRAELSQSSH